MDTDPAFLARLGAFAVANQDLGAWKRLLEQDPESIRALDGLERAKLRVTADYWALLELVRPN